MVPWGLFLLLLLSTGVWGDSLPSFSSSTRVDVIADISPTTAMMLDGRLRVKSDVEPSLVYCETGCGVATFLPLLIAGSDVYEYNVSLPLTEVWRVALPNGYLRCHVTLDYDDTRDFCLRYRNGTVSATRIPAAKRDSIVTVLKNLHNDSPHLVVFAGVVLGLLLLCGVIGLPVMVVRGKIK